MQPHRILPLGLTTLLLAPAPAQAQEPWAPADPPMLTRWAQNIDPAMPHPEYPRPQMARDDWLNLNGLWQYSVAKQGQDRPAADDGRILVPFAIESALSGVNRAFGPDDVLWYERQFEVPAEWDGRRVFLHFGAVDYRAEVLVNGTSVGTHEGGYDPFYFDITDHLDTDGPQALVVKVTDPTWAEGVPRGKQTLDPGGIMYTPASGIWQTVWLEPVAAGGIEDLRLTPDVDAGELGVVVETFGDANRPVSIALLDGDKTVTVARGVSGETLRLKVDDAKLWTPDDPFLYDLEISLLGDDDRPIDTVDSYVGMRSVGVGEVDGVRRLTLNGEPIFMFGPLDQGFLARRRLHRAHRRGPSLRPGGHQATRLQRHPQAHQGRAGPLVSPRRRAGRARVAGHALDQLLRRQQRARRRADHRRRGVRDRA